MSKESNTISLAFGRPTKRGKILTGIAGNSDIQDTFNSFTPDDRERILSFLEGKQSLQILQDKFFQHVFRPDKNPERITSLLSAILGQTVKHITPLPREGFQISESGSQVVMDIIARLDDGSIVNVEMQRIGYLFPGERTNCYLADMTMRQYNDIRSRKGTNFSYKDMRPIRLIVIMDQSSAEFRDVAPQYIHNRETSYSSGANVTDLDHVTYISLDTYRDLAQNEINSTLDAWLTFFSFEDEAHVINLIDQYPEFLPIYQDIAEFRKKPEEVIGMFSEALRIMDRNTTKYMIDELNQTIADLKEANIDLKESNNVKDQTITNQAQALADRDQTIQDDKSRLSLLESLLTANGIEIPESKC